MTAQDPTTRQPKGDHNRRLALGMDIEVFAATAGLSSEQVHDYEMTSPDHTFDAAVAERYGIALERLEANPPASQIVENGPASGHPAGPLAHTLATTAVPTPASPAVRPAGPESMRDDVPGWNETDEASDESFPASDPPAVNKFD